MDVLINWKTDLYEKLIGHNFWVFFSYQMISATSNSKALLLVDFGNDNSLKKATKSKNSYTVVQYT